MKKEQLTQNQPLRETAVSRCFFAYGGMKNSQRTKIHISNNDGNALCGVKSFWMQQYNKLDSKGMMHELNHINNNHKEQNTCKHCLKKFNELTGQNVC